MSTEHTRLEIVHESPMKLLGDVVPKALELDELEKSNNDFVHNNSEGNSTKPVLQSVHTALCDPLPEVHQAAAHSPNSPRTTAGNEAFDDDQPPTPEQLCEPALAEATLDGLKQFETEEHDSDTEKSEPLLAEAGCDYVPGVICHRYINEAVTSTEYVYSGGDHNGPRVSQLAIDGNDMKDFNFNANSYQQKKNLAQGMMDLALLTANANQLRYVVESEHPHPYYYSSLILISLSIVLQIAVGVGIYWSSRYNMYQDIPHKGMRTADTVNDCTVLGVFLITVVNVFIASYSVSSR